MKRTVKRDGWFRPRGYAHFDWPLSFEEAKMLATDPGVVARKAFLPLLGYTDIKRQYRTDNSDLSVPRKLRPKIVKNKPRDIKYAGHADAAILAYYAMSLQAEYEKWLSATGLHDSVIGYRSGLGSNVDMAARAFADVVDRGTVTALCFDVSDFFPTISHSRLKGGICKVLNKDILPQDWYRIYRETTKFCWVDISEAGRVLGFDPNSAPSPLVEDVNEAMRALRRAGVLAVNSGRKGIPQGTPISAIFANVAMCDFDEHIIEWANGRGGLYRRYSDDILILIDREFEDEAKSVVANAALKFGDDLKINPDKTEVSHFSANQDGCDVDHPLTYLGFTFDGRRVRLRDRTLSRFYRRMTYAARGAVRGAGKKGQPASSVFKRSIYRDLTHLGSSNFYKYASRADGKFHRSIVKRQLRNHFRVLLRKLENRGR